MNRWRNLVIVGICLLAGCPLSVSDNAKKSLGKPAYDPGLMGSWHVTRAQTSLVISVEPEQKAMVLWIREGSHSMERTSWKPFYGGILVNSVPRIRLWKGREGNKNELRAELESIPELDVDANKLFCDHFFMRRISYKEPPRVLLDRPVPERWTQETLSEMWNETAGRKRLPENTEETANPGE